MGDAGTAFSDEEINDIFDEAGEVYTDTQVIKAATRVIGLRRLLASSAKLTDYAQNHTRESASQVFEHLSSMLEMWTGELDTAAEDAATEGAVKLGALRPFARLREYPDA